jgi:hypothetical protein
MIPGYERNREVALAILEWLEARTDVDATLAAAISPPRGAFVDSRSRYATEPKRAPGATPMEPPRFREFTTDIRNHTARRKK